MIAKAWTSVPGIVKVLCCTALFVCVVAAPASAQIPDKFENLKVFPKDIPKADLIAAMRNFSRSLGVRCTFCHVGEEGQPLSSFDFVSDENDHKNTARVMMKMVDGINNTHLAELEKSGGKSYRNFDTETILNT